ncbi:hypothetical protein BBO99_00003548 [Phytophthora kernoviae]|uniref:WW domain-containing protein n=2 Tax=Phytophthora kernoviae TaxID=325452 RepID=A0A3R7HYF2_9STRA|nr:hypothetical protein G195_004289 [Phytophthora kernoviae 00238/432]KAG2528634.1 hypothetical protein JM18_003212 [Phytophthora kernoviae]RLN15125.1 hypothetical protein BBI17_003578 [Phytophthora kernoviae]RLN81627.1 hypothetical protein BBO99_00003548 [Phytophthora kernoviae]
MDAKPRRSRLSVDSTVSSGSGSNSSSVLRVSREVENIGARVPMSKKRITWRFVLAGSEQVHTVMLEHSRISAKKRLKLDGRRLYSSDHDMYVRRVKDTHGSLLSDGDERPPGTLLTWTFAFGLNGTNVHKLELRDLEKGEFVVVLDCRELKRVNHEDIHGDMWEFEYDLEDQHELDLVVTLVGDNKVYDFFIDGSSWSDISETEFVLESGWYPVYSRSRSAVYFRNETTGNTQWEAPLMSRKDSHVNRPLQPFEQVSPGSQGLEDLVHDMHAVSVSKQQEETQEEPESEHEHAPQLISMKQPLQPVQEVPEVSEVQEANLLDFSEVAVYSSSVNKPQTNGYEAFDPFNPATHTGFIPQKQEQNNQQTQPPVDLLGI